MSEYAKEYKDSNLECKLPDWIYYRLYNNATYVYNTESYQLYVYNETVKYILDQFLDWNFTLTVAETLVNKYDFGTEENTKYELIDFIISLVENKILVENPVHAEKSSNLDKEIQIRNTYTSENQLLLAQIELTYRCQEKCKYCYCVTEKPCREELNTLEIKQLLNELYDMGVFNIVFTGGDPFVRKDIFEILEYAHEKRFLIDIFTNGIALTDRDIIFLKSLHLRSVQFSIYSHIPEKHDAFTQVKGSYRKTTEAIRKCIIIGIPVYIKVTFTNYNIDDAQGIFDLVRELGCMIQIGLSVTAANDGDKNPTKYRINDIDNYVEIMKLVNSYTKTNNYYVGNSIENEMLCTVGTSSVYINPYGDVLACNSLPLNCGNVRAQSIENIWRDSETLNKIRNLKKTQIRCWNECENHLYCDFCPGNALLETGDIFSKYDEACNLAEAKRKLYENQ